MKTEIDVVFSDHYYTGVFDSDFRVLYSDHARLFRLLSIGGKKLIARINNSKSENNFTHIFRFQGCMYKAEIARVPNGTYLCQIFKEIPDDELKIDELFDYVEEIRYSTLNIHSMAKMLAEYADDSTYLNDEFHYNAILIKNKSADAWSRSYNIINAFNNNLNSEFIPLNKYLLRTLDIMQFVTRKLENRIALNIDIVYPCVKIDYSKFELALYNLMKMVLLCSESGKNPDISIKTINENNIELKAQFSHYKDVSIDRFDLEIRAIKYIFRRLGGYFVLSESDDGINAYGIIDVEFSCDEDDIAEGLDIVFIGNDYILNRREELGRYIRIYDTPDKCNVLSFASEVTELSDIYDSDTRMAEMFFSDVL